jgi:hypothetical protein
MEVNGMNPETNKFEQLAQIDEHKEAALERAFSGLLRPNGKPIPKHWTILTVGQDVVVENYTFTVAHIGESHLLLEPKGPVIIGESIDKSKPLR